MYHPVQFVSLGPGDPELITIKALKALRQADVIFYPETVSKEGTKSSRALDILFCLEIQPSKLRPFNVPMSKDRSLAVDSYNNVSDEVETAYKNGLKTVVVTEGDAGFYSSIHYIYDNLKKRSIPVEQIAGIPAFIACGALAGIHIVKKHEKLIVIPGSITGKELFSYMKSEETFIIMKLSKCEEVIKSFIQEQPQHKYHYFENVGINGKEYYTSDQQDILHRIIPYFSLIIIQP